MQQPDPKSAIDKIYTLVQNTQEYRKEGLVTREAWRSQFLPLMSPAFRADLDAAYTLSRSFQRHQQAQFESLSRDFHDVMMLARRQHRFIDFVRHVWPATVTRKLVVGRHHEIMAEAFARMVDGELKRLMINMPPRFSKSEFGSVLLPAWSLGKYPDWQIIELTHTAPLATAFGAKVRDLVQSPEYQSVFPYVQLAKDSKAKNKWNTSKKGCYHARGMTGSLSGIGADLAVLDDMTSENDEIDARSNPLVYAKAMERYQSGALQRLQPGGRIAVIGTRWNLQDPFGLILDSAEGTLYEVIKFPALLNNDTESMCPELWSLEELLAKKASMPARNWNAQYMQDPTAEAAAVVKREYWRKWPHEQPPKTTYKIMSLDTASETGARNDYTAMTLWGLFSASAHGVKPGAPIGWTKDLYDPSKKREGHADTHIILLHSWRAKIEYPELKRRVLADWSRFNPDQLVIEAKSSGTALFQDLSHLGVFPSRAIETRRPGGGFRSNKHWRLQQVADLWVQGLVWAPVDTESPTAKWLPFAEDVIEEIASFGSTRHDDLVDSTVQAMEMIRRGHNLVLPTDIDFEEEAEVASVRREYY